MQVISRDIHTCKEIADKTQVIFNNYIMILSQYLSISCININNVTFLIKNNLTNYTLEMCYFDRNLSYQTLKNIIDTFKYIHA